MPQYMITYRGAATDMSDMTPEEGQAVMEKWGAWMGRVGEALTDHGAPLAPSGSVVDDGSEGSPPSLNGYSIIEAEDLDDARGLVDGHPFLSDGNGDYAVDIYEVLPNPM